MKISDVAGVVRGVLRTRRYDGGAADVRRTRSAVLRRDVRRARSAVARRLPTRHRRLRDREHHYTRSCRTRGTSARCCPRTRLLHQGTIKYLGVRSVQGRN